eukprot:8266760-Pyramimonas_sp.AAC.1
MEEILSEWVSEVQRGFIGGRSFFADVLDVDAEMWVSSVGAESRGRGVRLLRLFERRSCRSTRASCWMSWRG